MTTIGHGEVKVVRMYITRTVEQSAEVTIELEDDDYEALKSGKVAVAGLDVYEQEPLPEDHEFRTIENLNLTPHLGASTAEAQESVGVEIAEAVAEALLKAVGVDEHEPLARHYGPDAWVVIFVVLN